MHQTAWIINHRSPANTHRLGLPLADRGQRHPPGHRPASHRCFPPSSVRKRHPVCRPAALQHLPAGRRRGGRATSAGLGWGRLCRAGRRATEAGATGAAANGGSGAGRSPAWRQQRGAAAKGKEVGGGKRRRSGRRRKEGVKPG